MTNETENKKGNNREKIEKLETLLKELPEEKRIGICSYIADLYGDFASTLLNEQAAGVCTGLAQAIHGENAIMKVNLSLADRYRDIASYFQQQAQKLQGCELK